MPFPETRAKLKEAGYDFMTTKRCRCGAAMELWHTPKDQIIPMDAMSDDDAPAISHWATCSEAAQFRKQRAAYAPSHELHPEQTPPRKPNARARDMTPLNTRSTNPPRG